MDMSYRRACLLIDNMTGGFRKPLVQKQMGGNARWRRGAHRVRRPDREALIATWSTRPHGRGPPSARARQRVVGRRRWRLRQESRYPHPHPLRFRR